MPKRKANGEGSIDKLPSESYRLRTVDEVNRSKVKNSFTAPSPAACHKMHKQWLQNVNKEVIEKVQTVGEWADQWVELYKKPALGKPVGTYKDYKMYIVYEKFTICCLIMVHLCIAPLIGCQSDGRLF